MEDAMILNKGALERGFMHGRILATKLIDLTAGKETGPRTKHFCTSWGMLVFSARVHSCDLWCTSRDSLTYIRQLPLGYGVRLFPFF